MRPSRPGRPRLPFAQFPKTVSPSRIRGPDGRASEHDAHMHNETAGHHMAFAHVVNRQRTIRVTEQDWASSETRLRILADAREWAVSVPTAKATAYIKVGKLRELRATIISYPDFEKLQVKLTEPK